jgi:hypothetical protein
MNAEKYGSVRQEPKGGRRPVREVFTETMPNENEGI